jgi:single-strand DNA-binding protein
MFNYVTLVGNLGSDPEFKKLETGVQVAEFRIACNEIRNSDGQRTERTHWFSCTAFGKLAEICREYLKKGRRVGIHGSLYYSSWENEKGGKRSRVSVNVRDIEFLDSRPSKSQPSGKVPVSMREF